MMGIWATLFSASWKREERGLRILWDNLFHSERQIEFARAEFEGTLRADPITERIEP